MNINEESVFAVMNPLSLLAGAAAVCLLAWFCARKYRDTNDFKKSVRLYVPCAVVLGLLLMFVLQIDVILCIGLGICGFVVLALISNHYFYH